jgi:hypothetical protein
MLKALGKSILFGLLFCWLVTSVASLVTEFMMPDEKNITPLLALTFKHSMFLWVFLAFAIMLTMVTQVKWSKTAFIGRAVLIVGPISFGWAMFAQQGKDSWFLVGMFISSIFLMYEFVVVPKEKMKNQVDTTQTKRNK